MSKTNNTLQVFWIAMGSLSSFALSIVSAAILSRYFSKTDYGTYKQILYVYTSLLMIFSAGLPRVFAYFLPRYTLEEGKHIVWKLSKLLLSTGIIFSAFLFLFSGVIANVLNNPNLSYALKLFSPIPIFLLPTLGIEGIFSTYKKSIYIAIYNTISRILMLLFIVLPVTIFGGNYIDAIYGWLIVSVITFLATYFIKNIPFKNIRASKASLTYKDIFGYSLPLVTASLWGLAIRASDQFYVSRFFGAETFAEFSNGFIELPIVAMVTGGTSLVLMPIFSKAFHENKGITELMVTWRNTLHKSALIIYPLIIYFIAFAIPIMVLIYSEKYTESYMYFQINMVLNFFNIIIFAPLFLSMGQTRLYARIHMILAILIWTSTYVVIVLFKSPVAVALNSTFLNIIKILYFIHLASKLLKLRFADFFPIKKLIYLFLHSVIIVTLVKTVDYYLINTSSVLLNVIITFTLFGVLLLVTGPLFKIDYYIVVRPLIQKFIKK